MIFFDRSSIVLHFRMKSFDPFIDWLLIKNVADLVNDQVVIVTAG